jgi:2-polyprenyl-3-methyl-5-hydroxy-6-metoxy-1,4-benzoquinol methylase
MPDIANLDHYPALRRLVDLQLRVWPEHDRFLGLRFARGELAFADRIAGLVERIADDLDVVARDYRWLCERMSEEELHFKRTGKYRLASFADADREVYSNPEYMRRYMNGVLLSHIWWDNHARVIEYYVTTFLGGAPANYRHLEIGPGHGLLLYLAAQDPNNARAVGWDVSETSIAATRAMLGRLGVAHKTELVHQNLFDSKTERAGDRGSFDSIVISEVLEHMEDPRAALVRLYDQLAPGGRLFVNVPINSPAPDHIYLLTTPEQGVELVESAGFSVVDTALFPMTGFTEPRARKVSATISCAVIATRPEGRPDAGPSAVRA